MTAVAAPGALNARSVADTALGAAARLWFAVALIGQWAFVYYIANFYGPSTLTGNFQSWSRNTNLVKGYVAGDTAGNVFFGAHALLAAVIAFGGAIQLIPQIRTRAVAVHRWNGRLFMLTALGVAFSGLYLIWVRGSSPTFLGAMAISLNGLLIIACVALAWRAALTRDLAAHRRWALRAYLVANGQWFFRVGIFAVALIDRRLMDPFFMAWGFGCTLAPLAVLELYLRARDKGGPGGRLAMAGGLLGLSVLTGLGYMAMWRPLLTGA
ncbi:MAG: rane protein [Caulobacteraceae bacterium]|nr:rane protein [Caulobacteraceae bacterium]